jgi:hypothetical protein
MVNGVKNKAGASVKWMAARRIFIAFQDKKIIEDNSRRILVLNDFLETIDEYKTRACAHCHLLITQNYFFGI